MEKLVKALEAAMAADLKTLDWMSDATKVEARKKLDAITRQDRLSRTLEGLLHDRGKA